MFLSHNLEVLCVCYPCNQVAVLNSWGSLGTIVFSLWVPKASVHRLSLGQCIPETHITVAVVFRHKKSPLGSKLCCVNLSAIKADHGFYKVVDGIIITSVLCFNSWYMRLQRGNFLSTCSSVVGRVINHKTLLCFEFYLVGGGVFLGFSISKVMVKSIYM